MFFQVITHNVENSKEGGKEIEKVHEHIFIFVLRCCTTLNLIFKDFVVAFPWMSDTYIRGKTLKKIQTIFIFILLLEILRLKLLKVRNTEFGAHRV